LETSAILWVVLAFAVAFSAKKRGRSFGGFLVLSLLLSPVIGFIVLAIKGKKYTKLTYTSIVYVSRSGSKYHSNRGCPALRSVRMIGELPLEDAVNSGLTACEKCM
jgi:hypothetical protein